MAMVDLPSPVKTVKLGHRGPLVVSVFAGWPDGASLRAVAAAQKTVAATFGKIVSIAIIPPVDLALAKANAVTIEQAPGERDASLKASVSVGDELSSITIASAMVVLPRGLVAVMITSFMAGLALVMRSRTPLRTFRALPESITWLESHPGAPKLPGALEDIKTWLNL